MRTFRGQLCLLAVVMSLLAACTGVTVSVEQPDSAPIGTPVERSTQATANPSLGAATTAAQPVALVPASTQAAPATVVMATTALPAVVPSSATGRPPATLAATITPRPTVTATVVASPVLRPVETAGAASATGTPIVTVTVNMELVFDASGSMAGPAGGGETKIRAAQRAMAGVIAGLPDNSANLNVGFRVFGHKGDNTEARKAESCRSTELLVPVKGVDKSLLRQQSNAWQPTGWTPISLALEQAGRDLQAGPHTENVIVLVTDGIETCEGDPCAVAAALAKSQAQVRIHVVGFGVEPDVAQGLRCIAGNGGGSYYDAPTGNDLATLLPGLVIETARPAAPELPEVSLPTPVLATPYLPTPYLPTPYLPTPVFVPPKLPGSNIPQIGMPTPMNSTPQPTP